MTIGEVAKRCGLAASAIRFYEESGVLRKPPRAGGRRQYSASILERLAVLERAKSCGFTLEEIRMLFYGFRPDEPAPRRWQSLARKKLAQLDELEARIAAMKALLRRSCQCRDLGECGRHILAARQPHR